MARRFPFQNSFSAGELAPEFILRSDLQPRNEGLKTARNIRLLQGGGFRRRYGSVDLAGLAGDAVLKTLGVGADDATLLVFLDDTFQERDTDGVLIQQVIGAPWATADLATMQAAISQDEIVVTSQAFTPQDLKRAATWALSNFAFLDGINGSLRQPYWRFADAGVAIAPSAYTGAINIVASAAAFKAAHVGTRIRYTGIEITITGFTNSTHVAGTVVGNLYPSIDVTLASSVGFSVGQDVQGEDTQIKGVVATVTDATHLKVQLTGGYTYFSTTEKLIGPTAVSLISAVALNATPAPTTDWDEQMISAVHGYPGACAFHRTRLLLGDFPEAKNAFAASTTGLPNDFDTGTGVDTDAIVETVGRDSTLNIKHFGSTEQLIMLTEAGAHYVPEQVAAPLSPTNFEILPIGPEADGAASPVFVAEGLLFTELRSGRLMIAVPTGNVRRSWDINDLAELAYHLMGTPVSIELIPADSASDRLVFNLRDDGKFAVMSYRRAATYTAWAQWETTGDWRSMTAAAGDLYVVARRTIAGVVVYRLERLTDDVVGDGVVRMPGGDLSHYNGHTCSVWSEGVKIGEFPVAAGAVTGLPAEIITYDVGLDFDLTAETVPPIDPAGGLHRKIRIPRVTLDVVDAIGVKVNGQDPVGFQPSIGVGGLVEPFTGQLNFYLLGNRKRDATLTVTQTQGGPLEVRSLTAEVTS